MANFKTNAIRIIETNHTPYILHTYDFDGDYDGRLVADKIGKEYGRVFKTLVTVSPSKSCYVFVVPVSAELDLKACAGAVGEKRIEMIPVKDINKITGYVRGGCSPIGMKRQYPTVFDAVCLEYETIVFSAGKIGYQVELSPEAAIELTGGITANICRN